MLSSDIIKKIKHIQIKTNHLVTSSIAGSYESAFKGHGMNFEEVREYQYGDDVRSIDWNVTARMDNAYIKLFREERELTIMLLVDLSASGKFGSTDKTKNELAAEVAAILACTAIKNNDKVGMIIFTDRVEKYIPPKKGTSHIWRVIREILSFEPENTKTDLSKALEYLMLVVKKRSVAFLVSDFISSDYEKALKIANKQHDVISVFINDPREYDIPRVGLLELEDAETGETVIIDTNSSYFRKEFLIETRKRKDSITSLLKSADVDFVDIWTDKPYIDPIIKFFKMRGNRFK
ncbi:MAG: DUF58 domain-containing protein [Cyanobacteriota bacterium]